MRISGGGHAALGEEAAAAVMQAASLATRRGHAQVTPLHVASAVLSASPALLLRSSDSQASRSNPLQYCSALRVCLGVALDRLAVVLVPHHNHYAVHVPAPSNALVAALKRAQQARRRRRPCRRGSSSAVDGRGGGDQLERLVASVLDDPTVDRVVRAAASFSESLQVADAHAAVSLEQSNRGACCDDQTNSPTPAYTEKIWVGGGQPSTDENHQELQPVVVHVPDGSESQASHGTAHAGAAFFKDGTEVLATPAATFPPWFRRYQDTLLAGSTHCGGASSLQVQAQAAHRHRGQWKFTDITAENLKTLCGTLELRVPWQHRGIVPGISSVVLRCRSGMARNKPNTTTTSSPSSSTWLLFRGSDDGGGKTAVARELARLVFGSYSEFTTLEGNSASGGKLGLKRQRPLDADGGSGYVGERLFEALWKNPHRVILVNGVDRLDRDLETLVKNAVKEGMVKGRNGEAVNLEDAIVVLTMSSGAAVVDSRSSAASSPRVKKRGIGRQNGDEVGDGVEVGIGVRSRRFRFDLNACAEDQEDGEEEEEDDLADQEAGILDVVDGVFCFD